MKKNNYIPDTFDTKVSVDFCEENTVIDGKHVLAKVKGEFFCPDGISRNNRFYSKKLWENTLSKKHIQEKLERKIMFGTIGHKTPINDEAWQEGKITHFINFLGINEDGKGIGEAYVLDTPAGRNVNAVLRAGCNVFVSSRANGRFKGEKNGIPKVDEEFFDLETFDFVLDPGFLQANPKLAESLNNETENEDTELQGEMNMELQEKILNENVELKSEIKTTLKENKELKESLGAISEDAEALKEAVKNAESNIASLTEELEATKSELVEAKEAIEKYEELCDGPEDLQEALEKALNEIERFHDLGNYEQVKEALEVANEELEKFAKLGSYEVIEKVIVKADEMMEAKIAEERQAMIEEIATEYKVKETVVEALIAKGFTKEEMIEHFSSIVETKKKEEKFADDKEENLGEDNKVISTKSRLNRLVESFE